MVEKGKKLVIKLSERSFVKERRVSTISLFFILLGATIYLLVRFSSDSTGFIVISAIFGFVLVSTTMVNNAFIPLTITIEPGASTLVYARQRSIGKYREQQIPLESITSIHIEDLKLNAWSKVLVIAGKDPGQSIRIKLTEGCAVDTRQDLYIYLGI